MTSMRCSHNLRRFFMRTILGKELENRGRCEYNKFVNIVSTLVKKKFLSLLQVIQNEENRLVMNCMPV